MLLTRDREALVDFRKWLNERFGARLGSLVLFGSRARGDGSEESDVDVLVVIADLTSAEAREVRSFVGDLLTIHDVLISPFVLSDDRFEQLRRRERRIIREIERDGIPL